MSWLATVCQLRPNWTIENVYGPDVPAGTFALRVHTNLDPQGGSLYFSANTEEFERYGGSTDREKASLFVKRIEEYEEVVHHGK